MNSTESNLINKMESNTNTQNFKNAIVFEIELMNGVKSSITTIYQNKDISFEEIILNMGKAIEKTPQIKAMIPSVGSIREGKYKRNFFYGKKEFNRETPIN